MKIGLSDAPKGSERAKCPRCEERERRQRRRRRLVAIVSLLVVIIAIAGIPVYVNPRTDPLRKADAIIILGGHGYRKGYGFFLYQQGWAPNVVIANSTSGPQLSPDAMWIDKWCKSTTWGSDVLPEPEPWPTSTKFCPNADPPTTLGEARALRSLAAEHGWHSVIVVTFRPHIARARMIFERCFEGDVIMEASPVSMTLTDWVYEYVNQTIGLVKTLVDKSC